ncbi:Bdr family repetitive protein [Borreliella bavariensis]|uniref:Bdr family repetitive protein n=1 Tax=Borreliella bavariensis TaxID=664662 RepID=UPI001CB6FFA4|nr:Bdr family repetitive protein [Borreliella bavariensis]
MNNLAYRTYNIESIKNEFLNIGFSEEAIDFVFLHNDNYNFEFLKEKIIDAEKNLNTKIDGVEKSLQKDISNLDAKIDTVKNELNTKIDFVEKNLTIKIDNLDTKIDNLEKNLQKEISILNTNLNTKIDNVKNELTTKMNGLDTKIDNEVKNLRKDLNMGNRLIHFMILAAAILGPILNALFMKYLQFIK